MLSAFVYADAAVIATGGETDIRIEVLRYEPAPAKPGELLDLWVKISTSSKQSVGINSLTTLYDVQLELLDEFPFTAVSKDEQIKSFGAVGPGETRTVRYRVRVDGAAAPGTNEVRFIYTSRTENSGITSSPLDVEIKSVAATLSVEAVYSEPKTITAGEEAILTTTLRKDALTGLRDITSKIDLTSTSTPFAPIQSTAEKKIRRLGAGETVDITYTILALANAEAKVYKVPLALTYYDDAGNLFSKNDTIGLVVSGTPDLNVGLEESDTFQSKTSGDVVLSVANVGPSEVKFLTLHLLENEGYTVIGKNQEYLGNLESDDFETAEFKLYVKGKDEVFLKALLEYRDAYNLKVEEELILPMQVYTKSEVRQYGLDGDLKTLFTPLIYLLVILFFYFAIKDWRKNRAFDTALKAGVENLFLTLFRIIFIFRWRNLKRVPRRIKLFFQKL